MRPFVVTPEADVRFVNLPLTTCFQTGGRGGASGQRDATDARDVIEAPVKRRDGLDIVIQHDRGMEGITHTDGRLDFDQSPCAVGVGQRDAMHDGAQTARTGRTPNRPGHAG